MKMRLEDLVGLVAKKTDQQELLHLGQQYHEAHQMQEAHESTRASLADSQSKEILDQIMKRIQWHFRAIRHPLPTRQEVEEMIMEHFDKPR